MDPETDKSAGDESAEPKPTMDDALAKANELGLGISRPHWSPETIVKALETEGPRLRRYLEQTGI